VKNRKVCIAKRLKQARLAFGVSQKKLGMLVGIEEHSASVRMNQYETGKHTPNFLTLQNIGKVLGYPVAFFSSDDDLVSEIIHLTAKLSEADKEELLSVAKGLVLNRQGKSTYAKNS